MILTDCFGRTFNGFELDISKIKPHSASKEKIRLPYNGPLPEQFKDIVGGAKLCLNIQPGKESCVNLFANTADRMFIRVMMDAEPEEITSILDLFFFGADWRKNGLDPYWNGFWTGCYLMWRREATGQAKPEQITASLDKKGIDRLKAAVDDLRWTI